MQSLIDILVQTLLVPRYRYPDNTSQLRARVTLAFSLLMIFSSVLGLLGLFLQPDQSPLSNTVYIGATVALLSQIAVVALVHAGLLRLASGLFLVSTLASAAGIAVAGVNAAFLLVFAIPVTYAGLIWSWSGVLLAMVIEIATLAVVAGLQLQRTIPPLNGVPLSQVPLQTLLLLIAVLGVGAGSAVASVELQRALRHAHQLLIRLRATAEVASQSTATMTALPDLLKQIANYVRDRFGFYHVHLFLVDKDRPFVNLVASTSDVGDILLQRGYRLAVGSQSTVGQALVSGEPVSAVIEEGALLQAANELSRDVRSEVALPLTVNNTIIGVLNVQSARPRAFSQEDVDSLRIVATHISIAIHNGQIFEGQRTALNENRRLFLEAELNLREIQRLNQRLTGKAWDDYLKSHHTDAVGYTLDQNQLRADSSWTPLLEQAASKRRAAITREGERQTVAVPIELRGRSIGAIEVEMNSAVRQSDALDMLQAVAQRLALSIDNARLFEQAQELAQQELQVNAVTTKIQSTTKMDEILSTVVGELGHVLGADRASIRLTAANAQASPGKPNNINGADGVNGANSAIRTNGHSQTGHGEEAAQ